MTVTGSQEYHSYTMDIFCCQPDLIPCLSCLTLLPPSEQAPIFGLGGIPTPSPFLHPSHSPLLGLRH